MTGTNEKGLADMSIDGAGTERARCVLAPNPSPMTLDGTNTWVIAEPGSAQAVVVDPGPDDEPHLRRVHDHVTSAGQRVTRILLTHSHPDHAEGAATFAGMTGAPVQAADPAYRLGDEGLAPGYTITASGCEIHVVATPGHTSDTVLGRGTTVIASDGNLADYLSSLDRLRALTDQAELTTLLPGHGPVLADPAATLDYYISHRRERLAEITASLDAGDRTTAEIVARAYADVDRSLWPFAAWSVRAQLEYLKDSGRLPPGVQY